jgi:hypothetical protein
LLSALFSGGTLLVLITAPVIIVQVLRLTSDPAPDPLQLAVQASAISDLMTYRDFLHQQAEEERSRWESEKDGWARMAEALIAQRNNAGDPDVKDEVRLPPFITDRTLTSTR